MGVLYLTIACVLFAIQFAFSKLYQENTDGTPNASAWNLVFLTFFSLLYLLPATGFTVGFSMDSFILSLIYTVSMVLYIFISLPAMKLGKLTLVTTFTLLGGIAMPTLYGLIWLNEELTISKIMGMIFIFLSLFPNVIWDTNDTNKGEKKKGQHFLFMILCFLAFFFNGLVCVVSKMQSISETAVSTTDFLALAAFSRLIISLVLVIVISFMRKKKEGHASLVKASSKGLGKDGTLKGFLWIVFFSLGYAVFNIFGNIALLECAKLMDSSIQFPIEGAAVIVLTAFVGRIYFKEKFKKPDILCMVLAVIGILFYLFKF